MKRLSTRYTYTRIFVKNPWGSNVSARIMNEGVDCLEYHFEHKVFIPFSLQTEGIDILTKYQ